MKKLTLIFVLIFGFLLTATAQDVIVKIDATQIKAKVAEITPEVVRYKRFSNPDGPMYILPVGDIHYILYPNGEKEVFTVPTCEQQPAVAEGAEHRAKSPLTVVGPGPVMNPPTQAQQPAVAEGAEHRAKSPLTVVGPGPVMNPPTQAQQPAVAEGAEHRSKSPLTVVGPGPVMNPPTQAQQPAVVESTPVRSNPALTTAPGPVYVIKTYELGDVYNENGVKGIVCKLSEDKQHGLIISMDELYLRWSEFEKPNLRLIGANNDVDGEVNMLLVEQYITKNNLSWSDFPAFKWCRDKGEGWYFPSIDEILQMGHAYNGGTRMTNNRQTRALFNDNLKNNGGKRMDRMAPYFSSTEIDAKSAYSTHMTIEPPYVVDINKNSKYLVRAMRKF